MPGKNYTKLLGELGLKLMMSVNFWNVFGARLAVDKGLWLAAGQNTTCYDLGYRWHLFGWTLEKSSAVAERLHQCGWKSMCGFSRVRAAPSRGGKQFVAQLGAFSTVSVSITTPLSFCPALLFVDKLHAANGRMVRDGLGSCTQKDVFKTVNSTLSTCQSRRNWCVGAFNTTERLFELKGGGRRKKLLAFLAFDCSENCSHVSISVNIQVPQSYTSTGQHFCKEVDQSSYKVCIYPWNCR